MRWVRTILAVEGEATRNVDSLCEHYHMAARTAEDETPDARSQLEYGPKV